MAPEKTAPKSAPGKEKQDSAAAKKPENIQISISKNKLIMVLAAAAVAIVAVLLLTSQGGQPAAPVSPGPAAPG